MNILSRKSIYIIIMIFVVIVSIFGPKALSIYSDRKILNDVITENTDIEGYKYSLTTNEKLYILSNAIENRVLIQSDLSASTKLRSNLEKTQNQAYALIANFNDALVNDDAKKKTIENLKKEFLVLQKESIIPQFAFDSEFKSYDIRLFTALDFLRPEKTVDVWQIETNSGTFYSNGYKIFISAYVDFETGKLYSFSFRSDKDWSFYDPDNIIKKWCEYVNAGTPVNFTPVNPSIEETKFYKKYAIEDDNQDKTIVTIGFYEGINEFFLKISNR